LEVTCGWKLPVDLAHDNIDTADDGGHIRNQAAAADRVGDTEIAARRAGADAKGDQQIRGGA